MRNDKHPASLFPAALSLADALHRVSAASLCRISSPDISAAPSTATSAAPPHGTQHCNNAGSVAGGENAARSLSADTCVPSVVQTVASGDEKSLA
jgi:hypothetical protein